MTRRKPRILFVSERILGIDNPQKGFSLTDISGMPAIANITLGFIRRGWDVRWVQADPSFSRDEIVEVEGLTLARLHLPNVALGRLGKLLLYRWIWRMIVLHRKLRKLLSDWTPDLVYSHKTTFQLDCFLLSRQLRIPMVQRCYGAYLGPELHPGIGPRIWWQRRADILAFTLPVDLLITTNDGTMGDRVARYCRTPKERFYFWRNGIDRPAPVSEEDRRRMRQSLGLTEHTPLLVSACNLVGWKRVDRIIAAMPDILKAHPDARLAVVGDGDRRGPLETQARQLGVSHATMFLGNRPRREIMTLLAACDLCLCTYDRSNVGNSLLEALISGCCVVTLNTGATEEVIQNDRNGVLLKVSDESRIGRQCAALLGDPARRQRLRQGALQWADENLLTWAQRVDREIKLIESLPALRGIIPSCCG